MSFKLFFFIFLLQPAIFFSMEKEYSSDEERSISIKNQMESLDQFLLYGGDINEFLPPKYNKTRLHKVCQILDADKQHLVFLTTLLRNNADPNIVSKKGYTAIEMAIKYNFDNDKLITALILLKSHGGQFRPKIFDIIGSYKKPLKEKHDKEDAYLLQWLLSKFDCRVLCKEEKFITFVKKNIDFGHNHQLKAICKQIPEILLFSNFIDDIDSDNNNLKQVSKHFLDALHGLKIMSVDSASPLSIVPKQLHCQILRFLINSMKQDMH